MFYFSYTDGKNFMLGNLMVAQQRILNEIYSNRSKDMYFEQKSVNIETSKLIGLEMPINHNLTGVQVSNMQQNEHVA